jgi:hypothetical protein
MKRTRKLAVAQFDFHQELDFPPAFFSIGKYAVTHFLKLSFQ